MTTRRKPRATKPAAPKQAAPKSVYTPELPPRPTHNQALAASYQRAFELWYNIEQRANPNPLPPAHFSHVGDLTDWWHTALAERDAAAIAARDQAIQANNSDVAALANGLDLTVKTYQAADASVRVLQYDALAMAKRIEAAAAKHKNRGPRGHKTANRQLRYYCPTCMRPVRGAGDNRVLICAGTFEAPHDQTLLQFDEASQPTYRLADLANPENQPDQAKVAQRLAKSAGQVRHHQAATKAALASETAALYHEDEFGGL